RRSCERHGNPGSGQPRDRFAGRALGSRAPPPRPAAGLRSGLQDPRPRDRGVSLRVLFLAALAAAEHESEGFLGLPMWIWQLANRAAFLGVLGYFVARPLAKAFRARQDAVEERIRQARQQREDAARLETEIHERMAKLDVELADVRARGFTEGEAAR